MLLVPLSANLDSCGDRDWRVLRKLHDNNLMRGHRLAKNPVCAICMMIFFGVAMLFTPQWIVGVIILGLMGLLLLIFFAIEVLTNFKDFTHESVD